MTSCVVVGGGLAGLLAARRLRDAGLSVTVLDAGSQPGGRLATRREMGGVWDVGAQHFTAREEPFVTLVDDLRAAGVVRTWFRGLPPPDPPYHGPDDPRRHEPHHRGHPAMSAIADHLAGSLDVRTCAPVARLIRDGDRWRAETADATTISSDAALLTAPVPESLALLDAGGVRLPAAAAEDLRALRYEPSLCVLGVFNGRSELPEAGAWYGDGDPVSWLGDNHRKDISPIPTVTIHAGPQFSREHLDADAASWAGALAAAAEPLLGRPVRVHATHRWRYATPVEPYPERSLVVEDAPPLVFAGDAFHGPRVEGAALSGLAAADVLLERLGT
ncbi:MAG: FAD-dependent oxidoreductase [Actinomycetota bacterium]|nr:FAD-dependent oxidoreductase [Actinomycetota bacterium]